MGHICNDPNCDSCRTGIRYVGEASVSAPAPTPTNMHTCDTPNYTDGPCYECAKEKLQEWVFDRYENCVRLAAEKSGEDKQGWLDDAGKFLLILSWMKEKLGVVASEVPPSAPAPTPTQPDYKALCEMAARILLQHMNDEDYEMSLAGLYSALTEHTLVASEVQPTPTHQGDWIWEDELPKGYPYKQMFEHSKLGPDGRGGCRIFPKLPLKLGVEVQPTDERAEQDRQFKEARELVNSYEDRHKHLHGYYSRTDLLTVARLAARVLSGGTEEVEEKKS